MPCGCCLLAVAGSLIPRLTIGFLWIFTSTVDNAFNGFILPLLGLLFLPFTTLVYVVSYWAADGSITWGWVFVLIAVFVDIGNYAAGGFGKGRQVTIPVGSP
ncbi:MAG: hypothetical protein BMS9Abin07_0264 [Acidimicrobiia bacterium]|nr:MAG: hypothetical protein BMS9Abin07_0264 [Acidimicrobiia bacterium]